MQQPQCDHVWTDWQETRPFTSRRRCRACGLTNDRPRARRGPRQGPSAYSTIGPRGSASTSA